MLERASTKTALNALLEEARARFKDQAPSEATVGWGLKSHGLLQGPVWFTDGAREDEIPTVWFLGKSRRPVSADPTLDLTLSLVSAAAAVAPQRKDLLLEAQNHPDPLVQRTANRLLNQIQANR